MSPAAIISRCSGSAVAVKEPVVIDKLANQTDLAATLLNQLGIGHDAFYFQPEAILSPDYPEYAFYTYSNGSDLLTVQVSPSMTTKGKKL